MKWILPIFVLFAVSCKLHKHSDSNGHSVEAPSYFKTEDHPELHQTLIAEYTVSDESGSLELSVYPLSDSAYEFDYVLPGAKGYAKIDENARANARLYENQFPDSVVFHQMSSIWLSRINFEELRTKGKTKMAFRNDSLVEFSVKGTTKQKFILQDTAYIVQAVEVVSENPAYYLNFVPDVNYPMILKQKWGNQMELFSVQNRAPYYNDFEPEQGCELNYYILDHFTEEYNVKLINDEWNDSLVKFKMSGKFTGADMAYDFDYDVVYKEMALKNPIFSLPVFSAVKGEKVEDSMQWIWLNSKEILDLIAGKTNYLSVPHFAEYPGRVEDYEDSASYLAAIEAYKNSSKTKFEFQKYGRLENTNYMFFGEDVNDEQLLPSWRFYSAEENITIEVLANKKFPILLNYGDENRDISLVNAWHIRD